MVALRSLAAVVAGLAAIIQNALAHSTQRNPLKYLSVVENAVLHTPSQRCHAHSDFELTFSLHEGRQKIRLSLEPNHDIFQDLQVHYLAADGSLRNVESINRGEHKVFRGNTFVQHHGQKEWTNVGWARITVHRDGLEPIFEGAFRIDGDHHHIQTGTNYRSVKHKDDPDVSFAKSPDDVMVVWRDSDVSATHFDPQELKRGLRETGTCESDRLSFNAEFKGPSLDEAFLSVDQGSLFGREIDGTAGNNGAGVNLVSTISNTNGCPTTRKVALVGIATDCTYTRSFNSSQAVRTNIIQQINAASQVYESTFNISLGIQNLTISDARCPGQASSTAPWNVDCSPSVDITDRLNLFSAWRGLSKDNNAFWTLLSTCNTDAAVGLAWLGQACQSGSQPAQGNGGANETIASANVVIRTPTEWQVIAHETGHTFGAVHDCNENSCNAGDDRTSKCCPLSASQCNAGGQFIMNPSTGSGITAFSPCSIGNICSGLLRNQVKGNCLTNNRDVNTIAGSQCGNGIVESGEDCDCGGELGCGNNPCCNPKTCKFSNNSVCDPSNEDCCTSQCQFASSGTVCRASTGFCDPEETCTGNSPMCPENVHKDDGASCGESGQGLQCASGQCTSRDLQCKTLIGARTTGNDTYACSSQGCLLSCASPQFGPNMCVTMNQNFLDGTACQGGGKCNNGVCRGSSVGNEILDWLRDNKSIAIPVGIVIGILLLLAIISCFSSCFRKRGSRSKHHRPRKGSPPPNSWPSYGGAWGSRAHIPAPPQAAQRGPPPQYSQYPQDHWHPQQPQRSMSMRYA